MLWNCEKDENPHEHQEHQIAEINYLDIGELPEVASALSGLNTLGSKQNKNTASRSMNTDFDSLNLTNILEYANNDGKLTYSFLINKENSFENPYAFENLHLVKLEEGYLAYILKWEPNQEWLENNEYNFLLRTFTGKQTHYDLDYNIIKITGFINGQPTDNNNISGKSGNHSRSMDMVLVCTSTMESLCSGIPYDCGGYHPSCGFGFKTECSLQYSGGTGGDGNNNEDSDNNNQTGGGSGTRIPRNNDSDTDVVNNGDAIVVPIPKEFIDDDPCESLSEDSQNSDFLDKMADLKTKSTTLNKEAGYIQKQNSTNTGSDYDYHEEDDIKKEIEWTIPAGTNITGMYHTHDDIQDHLPVFSADDLYALFALFGPVFDVNGNVTFNNPHNIDENNFTYVLITAHGTKLAMTFNKQGVEKLRQLGEEYFGDWNIDMSGVPQIPGITPQTDREKFEIKYKEFVDKDDSIEKQKKKFAKFLKKTNFGVSLFQATDDSFTQWEKINKSGNPTPCN